MESRSENPVKAALAYAWAYLKEISGENAYDHYLARHEVTHPDVSPLTRADFYRKRQDDKFSTAGSRCP